MNRWIVNNLAKVIVAALFVVAIAGLLTVKACSDARTAKTRTTVAEGQTGAATASGVDAVGVVGNRAAADAASDQLTRTNDVEIRNAPGADAPVAATANDAGLAALCRRAAYRDSARCVRR